jgi:cysteine-rich repeat protein
VANSIGVSPVSSTSCLCAAGFQWIASNSTCSSTCQTGYIFNTSLSSCVTFCGDGILAGTEQCDDGGNVDGDGCNADCTIGNNNSCPATTPYRDPITGNCTALCSAGYYNNIATFACLPCKYSCASCTTGTTCTSCSSANYRVFSGNQCIPMSVTMRAIQRVLCHV